MPAAKASQTNQRKPANMTTLTTLTTPTWINAPQLSDLRAELWAHEAKRAHKASVFPKYAGHSGIGIVKSRKDRKTLTKREFPHFLKRRPDLEEKNIYTVKREKEQNEQEKREIQELVEL